MAKASSHAPKERINVTFKPATGGAQEEIELPLKVMVMGDFLQRYDSRPLLDRKPLQVSKNNFDDVMEKQQLKLQVAIPNRLRDTTGEDETMNIDLDIKSLRDFEPEGVARQIPELRTLLELREALVSLKGPLGNIPSLRSAIEAALTDDSQREKVMSELGLGNLTAGNSKQGAKPAADTKNNKPE